MWKNYLKLLSSGGLRDQIKSVCDCLGPGWYNRVQARYPEEMVVMR